MKTSNFHNIKDTLATSGVYSTSTTGINKNIKSPLQKLSIDYRLESIGLVTQGVVKLLKPGRIRFTFDTRSTRCSQGVEEITRSSPYMPLHPPTRLSTVHLKVQIGLDVDSLPPVIIGIDGHSKFPETRRSTLEIIHVPDHDQLGRPRLIKRALCH